MDLSDRKKSGSVKAPFRGTENLEMRDIGVSKILICGNYFPDLHTFMLYDMDNLFEVQLTRVETLKSLDVTNCKRLVRLSATSDLSKLVDLKISQCPLLQEFSVVYFSCLEKIVIQNCSLLQCVSGISYLKKLIELNICQCPELQELSVVQLNHLKRFIIHNCRHLKILSGISNLTKLLELNISKCPALQQLSVLKLSNLEKCVFHDCSHLKIVSGISHLTKLVELDISQCPELQELSDLQSRNLEKIILCNCKIKSTISHLTKLVELEICESPVIGRLCLADLNSLKRIRVDDNVKLTYFELAGCENLKTISGMLNLENLETSNISITGCPELKELPVLRGPSCLEMITIDGCRQLHRLHLSQFKNLKRVTGKFDLAELFISDCPELEELPCFARLTLLKEITIVNCGKLYSITLPITLVELRLESCRQLEFVAAICDDSECPEVGLLPCVARVSCLQWITIQSCEKLQTIQGIHELYSLKSMGLSYCSNVAIQNCIPMLKRVPSEVLIFIGKAADEAYSTLSPHLFSDADSVIAEINTQGRDEQEEIRTQGSDEHESIWELNTVIVCALVMINGCTQIKMINKSLEDCYCNHLWPCNVQQGDCIITMVMTDQHKMNCFNDHRQFEDVLVKHGIMKKAYKVVVNKGEERIIQPVLHTIVNKLYQKQ
ncbi:uncharacterized protein LOC131855936 [Cryptomeria japonica]|uniref:uncharacterized protein LOC131855936 n=1 Tax=Cryptomeria japonica TaxID=3369 RepID=UPI0027D9F487|nr:uncharacterized protein LOC131855936 [Cryptomeria japonica]